VAFDEYLSFRFNFDEMLVLVVVCTSFDSLRDHGLRKSTICTRSDVPLGVAKEDGYAMTAKCASGINTQNLIGRYIITSSELGVMWLIFSWDPETVQV
jgi:hypothetical protein